MADVKRVYTFGNKAAEGNGKMRELLGGKGANLAEMNLIGIPVPPGFTITTEVCTEYYAHGKDKVIELLRPEVERAVKHIEQLTNMRFGDKTMPLLVSVRSGARASMPGMMDTILNLGMNDVAVEAVAKRTGNPRFAWDSYRRFVQMYGDVVLGMKPQTKEDHDPFEVLIEEQKAKRGVKQDTELTTDDLKELVAAFKAAVKKQTGEDFPADPWDQLWGAVCAVFGSWMNERAILYRKLNNIPAEWGTAVSVQAMVFGNMGENSATGVAFSRDAATGENIFNGEYLINAQGEDVVAGIRTPQQITVEGSKRWAKAQNISEEERRAKYPSLEEVMPAVYKELDEIQHHLEKYFTDMQDIEFTIQDGKLWMLQCRNGKRTGAAMVKIAMDMLREGLIDEKTAVLRCEPAKLDELLHPVFDKKAISSAQVITKGLPASPGAATGPVVFFAEDAEKVLAKNGARAILVRIETSPEDLKGLNIRVPGSEIYMSFFKAFGAVPSSTNWSEVFTNLQQGVIDGQEDGVSITATSGMTEVQDYMTIWNYTYENDLFLVNRNIWDSLNEATQQLLSEKALEACNWGRDQLEAEEGELIEEFRAEGMQVDILTDEQLEPFKEIVSDLCQSFYEKFGEEACAAFGVELD